MRIKSQWFNADSTKSVEDKASAIAFISWRVAQNMLKQMRKADFDIDIGQQYFAFTREVLAFLLHLVDRMAFDRMAGDERAEFTTALVNRIAAILKENEDTFLGERAAGELSYAEEFIALFNESGEHYAEFACIDGEPEFSFVRCFGQRVETLMPLKDRPWVVDQLMASEVPEAVETLKHGMSGVISDEPRKARRARSMSGD